MVLNYCTRYPLWQNVVQYDEYNQSNAITMLGIFKSSIAFISSFLFNMTIVNQCSSNNTVGGCDLRNNKSFFPLALKRSSLVDIAPFKKEWFFYKWNKGKFFSLTSIWTPANILWIDLLNNLYIIRSLSFTQTVFAIIVDPWSKFLLKHFIFTNLNTSLF